MTPVIDRPIHGVVRVLAVVTTVFTVTVLLVLGGLTTSFGAGMADPVWPTEPWFLLVKGHEYDPVADRGFLLEHTHRAAGFVTGILTTALAVAAWLSGPNKRSRLFAMLALIALLTAYGIFHWLMMVATKAARLNPDDAKSAIDWAKFVFPTTSAVATVVTAVMLAVASCFHLVTEQRGKWVRAACSFLLIGVMIQGLVGGFRVHLNTWDGLKNTLGVELSQLHGVFAQVVFSLMVLVPVLAAPRRAGDTLSSVEKPRLKWLALALPLSVFVQLVWAVWVRHAPTPLMQRLHLLTAFVVVGLTVWFAVLVATSSDARRVLRFGAYHLLGMLAVQVLLGVEAWMGKFNAGLPTAGLMPLVIRTLHQLIGTAILASSVVIALRVWRRPVEIRTNEATRPTREGMDATPMAA
jgi:heme A synthase